MAYKRYRGIVYVDGKPVANQYRPGSIHTTINWSNFIMSIIASHELPEKRPFNSSNIKLNEDTGIYEGHLEQENKPNGITCKIFPNDLFVKPVLT